MTTLNNIKSQEMTIGTKVINTTNNVSGSIKDIIKTDRGYGILLDNGDFDYAHRYINL